MLDESEDAIVDAAHVIGGIGSERVDDEVVDIIHEEPEIEDLELEDLHEMNELEEIAEIKEEA